MNRSFVAGILVAALVASGAFAVSLPSRRSSLPQASDGSGIAFECEDIIEGDRVEIQEETEDQRLEIRVEADTRVRVEARFESRDGSEVRQEARLDLCGIVQFADVNGDGKLDTTDSIVRSDLVAFGAIGDRLMNDVHVFETRSDEGNMTVTLRVPSVLPSDDEPLIDWTVVAHPDCDTNATHFAVKMEQEKPDGEDEFFAAPCGSTLNAAGSAAPAPPPPSVLDCEALSQGTEFRIVLSEQGGEVARTLAARAEASTRVRAEVRLDTISNDSQDRREVRLDLCGLLQFVDVDGDGALGSMDTVVSATLLSFDMLEHHVDGGFHVFETTNLSGNLSVRIRVPATFPGPAEPLVHWSAEANPTCDASVTHFAVKLEQEAAVTMDRFLVAACGTTLSATGEAG